MYKAGCVLLVLVLSALALSPVGGATETGRMPGDTRTGAAAALPTLTLNTFVSGLTQPVVVTHAGDGTGRLFVVEQTGRVRVVRDGVLLPTPFLDLTARVSTGGERGLLGLAFPPSYAAKGYFYVNYTNTSGHTVVARYRRNAANPDTADPASEQIVLFIEQPFANHNGGQIVFGPRDSMLYVGMGDGGSGGDPGDRAQNPQELLGKLLRLDTETGKPATYTVPADNPFVGRAGFRPEIWALGLRNPWRFTFDRLTGDLYTADVGQSNFEEVDFQSVASRGGENYGWRIMEGAHCFNPPGCSVAGLTLPVAEYDHTLGCSVTGGYVYRGSRHPLMQGLYLYGDFCSGRIWGLRREAGVWQNTLLLDTSIQISTFGEDEAGNLYVAHHGGTIFRVADSTTPATTVAFSSQTYNTTEASGAAEITVVRSGDTTTAGSVDYATADGTATERSDFTAALGTLRFAPGETTKTFRVLITDDGLSEGAETVNLTLRNTTGGFAVSDTTSPTLTIADNDAAPAAVNPIDESAFFVRQHYLDFLNREPDAAGLAFWVNNIESCGADAACRERKRIDTSAAFFLSIEFQGTGFLVYRFHQAAFASGERLRLGTFLEDTQEIGAGIIVGEGDWRQQLEARRQTFAGEIVTRPLFVALYPETLTPAQYIDALNANTGGSLSPAERDPAIAEFGGAATIADAAARARALRRVAEDADFNARERNRAFVLMQYFGYLRRNPDDPPEDRQDFAGFDFWLGKLNQFAGDFRAAEMVKSFLVSTEYRGRFGRP